MATYIFNFRGTAGYVTDGANSTYVLGETTAQTRNGITFQWTGTLFSVGDRFAGAPTPKLAGVNTASIGGGAPQFNVTLPTTGDKLVRVAFGDPYFSALPDQSIVIKDNGTTRLTVGPISPAGGNVVDAAGTSMTAASWSGSNAAVTVHFDTTAFQLILTAGTNYASICTLEITDVAAPTGVSATLAATLGTLTCASTATAPASASLSATLGTLTCAATASAPVAATLSQSLGALTCAATATAPVTASLSATLGALTLASTAFVGAVPVTATLTATLGALTCTAAATSSVSATLSVTLDPLTLAATAIISTGDPVTATLDVLLGPLTLQASASVVSPPVCFTTTLADLQLLMQQRWDGVVFWTTEEARLALNEALREWNLLTGVWRTRVVLPLLVGQPEIALPRAMTYGMRVAATLTGAQFAPLHPTSLAELDLGRPTWRLETTSSGGDVPTRPLLWAPLSLTRIAIWPASPTNVAAGLLADGVLETPTLTLPADLVDLNEEVIDYLVDFALHVVAFKEGGARWRATRPYFEAFLQAAADENSVLKTNQRYRRFAGLDRRRDLQPSTGDANQVQGVATQFSRHDQPPSGSQ